MNKEETIKFITALDVMYPNTFKDFDINKKRLLIDMWQSSLQDFNYEICFNALQQYVNSNTSGFVPTPANIISNINKIKPKNELSSNDAYGLVYKAICNSSYNSQEEWNKLPSEIQKIVSAERLRQLAKAESDAELVSFQASFKRDYEKKVQEQKEFDALPIKNQENILRLQNEIKNIMQLDNK